jgi:hypothetical protein
MLRVALDRGRLLALLCYCVGEHAVGQNYHTKMPNLLMKVQYMNDLRRWTANPEETLTIDSIERKIKALYFPVCHEIW